MKGGWLGSWLETMYLGYFRVVPLEYGLIVQIELDEFVDGVLTQLRRLAQVDDAAPLVVESKCKDLLLEHDVGFHYYK